MGEYIVWEGRICFEACVCLDALCNNLRLAATEVRSRKMNSGEFVEYLHLLYCPALFRPRDLPLYQRPLPNCPSGGRTLLLLKDARYFCPNRT
jgi:hypothetical protein